MNEERFDHLFHHLNVTLRDSIRKHHARALGNLRGLRKDAYRAAVTLKKVEGGFHNEFLAIVGDVNTWTETYFAPIEQLLRITRRDIFRAIDDGVTEAQFVKSGLLPAIRSRVSADQPNAARSALATSDVPAEFSLEEKVSILVKQNEALRAELRLAKNDRRNLLIDNEEKEKTITHMRREMNHLKKVVASIDAKLCDHNKLKLTQDT